ncbi:3-deoxy-7-phosphoheptulonate synthase class II, partial [archaeon]
MTICALYTGRVAGQFAKPRSNLYETIHNITLPSYRGDIINDIKFDMQSRTPDPDRMHRAYMQSQECMHMLHSIQTSDDGSLYTIHKRNVEFMNVLPEDSAIRKLYREVDERIHKHALSSPLPYPSPSSSPYLYPSLSPCPNPPLPFYTAHECLHLPYESSLTRTHNNNIFASSAHMVWVGERTRSTHGAHIHYVQGLSNPIGIKISQHITPDELRALLDKVNPHNIPGKVTCIVRMGAKHIRTHLPPLIHALRHAQKKVIWMTDPAHGNTVSTKSGMKTRYLEDMMREVEGFVDVCEEGGVHVGGMHLELSGTPGVAECVGGGVGAG